MDENYAAQHQADHATWDKVSHVIHHVLRNAASVAVQQKLLDLSVADKYFISGQDAVLQHYTLI